VSQTDQELLDEFVAGEKRALDILMARYQCFLKQQCRKFSGGNADDAKDLFSIVIFKVYTEPPEQLLKIRHMGGWLSRVAQNKAIDLQRSRIAEERRDEQLGRFYEIVDIRPHSPEQTLLSSELAQQIQTAFDTLPLRLRDAAQLRFIEDASYELIASHLGISQVNARKRVQEARLRLVGALKAYCQLSSLSSLPKSYAFDGGVGAGDDYADGNVISM